MKITLDNNKVIAVFDMSNKKEPYLDNDRTAYWCKVNGKICRSD